MHLPSSLRLVIRSVICVAVCALQGCGGDAPPEVPNTRQPSPSSATASASDSPAPSAEPTGKDVVSAPAATATGAKTEETAPQTPEQETVSVDETPREPATVAEAARLLDLRTLPLLDGAELLVPRTQVGSLDYKVKADVKEAFTFHFQQLKESGWQELPGSRLDGSNPLAVFTQAGFVVAMSAYEINYPPEKKGFVSISIENYGNVLSRSLPVPDGVEVTHVDETVAMYVTTAAAKKTRKQCDRLLLDLGWKPYGTAADARHFKKNAIMLSADVSTLKDQPGKTFISYGTELLSADIPMPMDYEDPRFYDEQKRVRFDCPTEDIAKVTAFYTAELADQDWRPTSEPTRIDEETIVIYRNQSGDMIELAFQHFLDECRVDVEHSTAAEVAELERRLKEEAQQRAAALAATEDDAMPKVVSPTPPVALDPPPTEQVVKAPADIPIQTEGETSEQPTRGILASQIPIPQKATGLQMEADLGMVIYGSELSVGELASFYRKELGKLGWEEVEDETVLLDDENVGGIGFEKSDDSLRIAIQPGQPETRTRIVIDGEGIIWPNGESDDIRAGLFAQ